MTFEEILDQAIDMLQRRRRLTYGTLKRQFQLDDAALEDLKNELIEGQRLAVDENGRVLVWTSGTEVALATPPSLDAERRQLTVLFCDLVGSTALSAQFDPEELRDVVRAYQTTCAEVSRRFDGHIAQYLGDGLLVYFGYPQAHEDDAARAVHTGLGIIKALGSLNTTLVRDHGVRLAVRIGIHTGLVVVGDMGSGGRHERLALGETPNIAARLQGLAAPDTVLISATTHQLVHGMFTSQALGMPTLKGLEQLLAVYHVLAASVAHSRFEVAVTSGLTPLVGRQEEVILLQRHWAQVKEGYGLVGLLSGEAGIGKSRLVRELYDVVERDGATRLTFRCSPYHQQTALYPIIEHLQRLAQGRREETPEVQLAKLEQALQRSGVPVQEVLPLLAALLSLPHPVGYPPLPLSPERQKQKTQEALIAWLVAEAEQQPVLAVWEDLHWADPSTLEWLGLFLEHAPTARLLTLLTCRPTFAPPWASRSSLTQLTLTHLTRLQVEEMVRQITGGKTLPTEVVRQIVARSDGVPLFVEEMTKTVLEAGWLREQADHYELTGPLPPMAIPATLQDALRARLDRLTEGKMVAQLGAVLGRTFAYELLQAVVPLEELALWHGLVQLVQAEVLYQRGVPPQATYVFKHVLFQEAAYQSLLKSTRQQYHQRTAQVIVEQFPALAETQPERLAQHYTEAGLHVQAVDSWQRAGVRARKRLADQEALMHCTKGLDILQLLPETPGRTQQELDLLMTLVSALQITKGYAAAEVGAALARARELCRQVEDTQRLYEIFAGLGLFYHNRGELQTARELGEQNLALAQRLSNAGLLLRSHYWLGILLYYQGEFVSAHAHLNQARTILQEDVSLAFRHAPAGVPYLAHAALVLWMLGYPDQALSKLHAMLALAQELSHAYSQAGALYYAATLHQYRREEAAAQERAEASCALATEQGFAFYQGLATFMRGWALAAQGQGTAGIAEMRQGLAAQQATGTKATQSKRLALLAEAYGGIGQIEPGLGLLAEALTHVDTTGERYCETELYRIKGELVLRQTVPDIPQAERCFQHALAVARQQQAKSLELRAAMSLARLWQQLGKQTEAHALLASTYGWFTEGFDTADLQETKALLEALADTCLA